MSREGVLLEKDLETLYRLLIPQFVAASSDFVSQPVDLFDSRKQQSLSSLLCYTDHKDADFKGLVDNGLLEILALDYIFGAKTVGAREIYVSIEQNKVVRVVRQFPVNGCSDNNALIYTSKDITFFPELIDRQPRCWPTNGVALFDGPVVLHYRSGIADYCASLQNDVNRVDRIFGLFLTVYLTPESVFPKRAAITPFFNTLLKTDKFIEWFLSLPKVKLEAIISRDFFKNAETQRQIQLLLKILTDHITVIIQSKITDNLTVLSDAIQLCEARFTPAPQDRTAHLFFVAVRAFLREQLARFCDASSDTPFLDRIVFLSHKIQRLIRVNEAASFVLSSNVNALLNKIMQKIKKVVPVFAESPVVDSEFMVVAASKEREDVSVFSAKVRAWLESKNTDGTLENQPVIAHIFEQVRDVAQTSRGITENAVDMAASVVTGATSMAAVAAAYGGSLFSSHFRMQPTVQQATVVAAQTATTASSNTFMQEMTRRVQTIKGARTIDELCCAMYALSRATDLRLRTLYGQFIKAVANQFLQVHFLVCAIGDDTVPMSTFHNITAYLKLEIMHKLNEAEQSEIERFFRIAVQRTAERVETAAAAAQPLFQP